ncbi:MAG: DNA polymerase III subunit beta [Propionibacteriaceae bacterium]|nr:DNA polymerase III subunit beta [Propionibacteriaceae bacterium]
MKITLERDVLADAVAWAARSLPQRPSLPILAGLLMKAAGDEVVLSSFDYETSAKITVPAHVQEEGEALVSGKLLADIAKSLPNKPVEFTAGPSSAELVCGKVRFTLQTLPTDEYPALPQMPSVAGKISASEFAEGVNQVVVAAGRDELLPIFTGVKLVIGPESITMLATDRYRMAQKQLKWDAVATEEAVALVPAKVLSEASKALQNSDEVLISLAKEVSGDGLIGFQGTHNGVTSQITTRLLDGEFPKVEKLMEITPSVSVRANTSEVIASVKRVALVAERNTSMRMAIEAGGITLEAATGDQAQAVESLEAVVEDHSGGEGLAVTAAGFNPHYLQDALNVLDSPFVSFEFTAPGKPCVLTQLDEIDGDPRPGYRHVIMLMRLPV